MAAKWFDSNPARSHGQLETELWLVSRSCDTNQKLNKKTDVFPQTLAGEDDSRKSHESSGWPRLQTFILPSHEGSTWNLASFGQAVSKEKKLENVNLYFVVKVGKVWVSDLEHSNKFSFPTSMGASYEIWLQSACGFWAKEVWKCWIWVTLDEDQWMTMTFDIHKGSYTHLVD